MVLIVLTRVLPVPATLGYEHFKNLVVDSVNGISATSLDEVRKAFERPSGGFHIVTFVPGQGVRRIVLDARETSDADASVRPKYHLEQTDAGSAPSP